MVLVSENLKTKMGDSRFETAKRQCKKTKKTKFKTKKFGNFLYIKNQYFDFETNITQQKVIFWLLFRSKKTLMEALLSQYRTDSLSARKRNVSKIDTLVKKQIF